MPRPKLELTFTFFDESTQEITTRLFRCTADEIAFERRFGYPVSAKLLSPLRAMEAAGRQATNGDTEKARLDALQGMDFEDRSAIMRAEDTAFFAWCVWQRNAAEAGNPTRDFDAWVATLAELAVESGEPVADAADPTSAALPG